MRPRQLSGREVAAALATFGFQIVSVRGSHAKLRRVRRGGERETLTVPLHSALAPGTIRAIYRHASRYIAEDDLKPFLFHP